MHGRPGLVGGAASPSFDTLRTNGRGLFLTARPGGLGSHSPFARSLSGERGIDTFAREAKGAAPAVI